jgi:hypothetical protein
MKWLSRFFSIVKFIFFQGGFSWIKYVVRGGYNIAPCPINCEWWAESNDTTLDFLAPPEDPHPTLPVIDRNLRVRRGTRSYGPVLSYIYYLCVCPSFCLFLSVCVYRVNWDTTYWNSASVFKFRFIVTNSRLLLSFDL